MTEIARRDTTEIDTYPGDPTGGRLVAWAQAAGAANQLAKALVTTTFVPAAFKGNVGDATAVILMGDELGLSPLAALRSIYAVHGAPALYARTMVALAQSHGHEVWTEATSDNRVIVCGQRRGSSKVERSEWTMDRARKAGYTNNKKYASTPQEMLYAKASGEVCRKIAADVLAGIPMSVEDLELEHDSAPVTTTVQRGPKKTMGRKTAEVAAPPEPEFDEPSTDAAPDPDPEPPAGAEPAIDAPMTEPQARKMFALYNQLGIDDRDDRLADAAAFLDRDIASSSELTKADAVRLIDYLELRAEGETK